MYCVFVLVFQCIKLGYVNKLALTCSLSKIISLLLFVLQHGYYVRSTVKLSTNKRIVYETNCQGFVPVKTIDCLLTNVDS